MSVVETSNTAKTSGILPALEQVRTLAWSPEQAERRGIYGFNSRDIRSRPFNLIRSRLLKYYQTRRWRTFGIVSASPGVGKSFLATNIAAALSRAPELRTHLLDLDLRRGSVARNFGYPLSTGVRQYLEGEIASLTDVSFRPANERLVVIPSDRSSAHSAEILSGSRMALLGQAMREAPQEHLFVCDLPPVFANDDASIVVSMLDAYVMVVEDGHTTRKQITEAIATLDRTRCAGVVLNHFHGGLIRDTLGYGYGGYNKKYGDYFNQ